MLKRKANPMTKISEMTPEELRIKCAEKCGWNIKRENDGTFWWIKDGKEGGCPDYQHDRNALQELIEAVPRDKKEHFVDFLTTILREKINYKDQRDVPMRADFWKYK